MQRQNQREGGNKSCQRDAARPSCQSSRTRTTPPVSAPVSDLYTKLPVGFEFSRRWCFSVCLNPCSSETVGTWHGVLESGCCCKPPVQRSSSGPVFQTLKIDEDAVTLQPGSSSLLTDSQRETRTGPVFLQMSLSVVICSSGTFTYSPFLS